MANKEPSFLAPLQPDEHLAKIVGPGPLNRMELVQAFWGYVGQHRLHDKKNPKMINADGNLLPIFEGKKQVPADRCVHLLNEHFQVARPGLPKVKQPARKAGPGKKAPRQARRARQSAQDGYVLDVAPGNKAYEIATGRALDTIAVFRRRLADLAGESTKVLIKTLCKGTGRPISLWLAVVQCEPLGFVGEVFETFPELPDMPVGSRHFVSEHALMDWMINADGRIHGGYTLRVERERMSKQKQKELDKLLGAKSWEPV